MDSQYAEVKLTGIAQTESRETDVKGWESEFQDTLTKDPCTTDLAQFKIDTGEHPPISQAPYNAPQSLVESVNKELK